LSHSLSVSLSRSSCLAACIFTHSDGARRNAGRPAPRRFSRSRPVVYFFKHAHAPPCISHAHDWERDTHSSAVTQQCGRRHSEFDRGNDVVIFRPGLTAKIKNVRRIVGDRAGRYNRCYHKVFVLPNRIDSTLSWHSTGASISELFVKYFSSFFIK